MQNTITASLLVPKRVQNCGAKVIWRATVSSFLKAAKSSIYSYECGCDELKKLYEIMADTDGIYGGRFSGAGFKGCCMALIDPDKAEDIEAKVTVRVSESIPGIGRKV